MNRKISTGAGAHKVQYIRIITSSIRSRGLWSGVSLTALLIKSHTRDWFGKHHRRVTSTAMAGLIIVAGILGYHSLGGQETLNTGGHIWQSAFLTTLALAGLAVGLAHFLLPIAYRRQLWLRTIYAVFFATLVGCIAYLGFDRWTELYRQNPASATLFGLLAVAILLGFREVAIWFLRSILIRDMSVGDISDLASLSEEGKWRVALHEAGHALCYGLCTAIPEDAYVALDSDMINLMAGTVNIPTPKDPTELTRERLEWMMLMTIAGVVSEEVFLGEGSLLGGKDMDSLNNLAAGYLSAGHGEVFMMEPSSELDVTANRGAIGRLRDKMREEAMDLIRQNQQICEEIAKEILATEFLDCERIAATVAPVVVPKGWQRMTWPASLPVIPIP